MIKIVEVNLYSNLDRIVQGVLSIPHSTACLERIFSFQNFIKTIIRNGPHVEKMSSLIQCKDLINTNTGKWYDKYI